MSAEPKPILEFDTAAEWEDWLATHDGLVGVRLRLRKKSSSLPGLLYPDALDVALCYGWIDGQIQSVDDDYFLRAFTPRRRNSPWSKVNRSHVERLRAEGRMTDRGLVEVERAVRDGRWDAAYRQSDDDVPLDLQQALDRNPGAAEAFRALTKQERFSLVFRLDSVKCEETRRRKIVEYIERLQQPG